MSLDSLNSFFETRNREDCAIGVSILAATIQSADASIKFRYRQAVLSLDIPGLNEMLRGPRPEQTYHRLMYQDGITTSIIEALISLSKRRSIQKIFVGSYYSDEDPIGYTTGTISGPDAFIEKLYTYFELDNYAGGIQLHTESALRQMGVNTIHTLEHAIDTGFDRRQSQVFLAQRGFLPGSNPPNAQRLTALLIGSGETVYAKPIQFSIN